MTLKEFQVKYQVGAITLEQWKADGSFMANVTAVVGGVVTSVQLFTTKATGKNITPDSPVKPMDGKLYIGEFKKAVDTITIAAPISIS
jgi:hypothetical protein